MEFEVTIKTPGVLSEAIGSAVMYEMGDWINEPDEELRMEMEESYIYEVARIMKLCKQWFRYGELITLVINTEEETCKVKEI